MNAVHAKKRCTGKETKEGANDNLYVSEEIEHYTVKDDYNKDRYVKLLLLRIDEQKKTIETYEKCIESLTECIDILKSQGGVSKLAQPQGSLEKEFEK